MINTKNAIERIKILECPTGEIENRIIGILEDYNVANKSEIVVSRDESSDTDDAEAYRAVISDNTDESFVILAKSGLDDYVAKVVNVYTNF